MNVGTLAAELGISTYKVGSIIYGPYHVALDNDTLTDDIHEPGPHDPQGSPVPDHGRLTDDYRKRRGLDYDPRSLSDK